MDTIKVNYSGFSLSIKEAIEHEFYFEVIGVDNGRNVLNKRTFPKDYHPNTWFAWGGDK